MRPGTPSLAVNGSKEIGFLVAVISSPYVRLSYGKSLAWVKKLFASIAANHRAEGPLGN
jgi:hypothetical protein